MDMEATVMELIINAGESRSCAMQALIARSLSSISPSMSKITASGANGSGVTAGNGGKGLTRSPG